MRAALHGFAVLMSVGAATGVLAGERYGDDGYGYGGGYAYAGEAIGGDYIGAPLTRFPRPSELVPTPWGYGTYGVPTVAGIRQAPTAAPTLTVIDSYDAAPARRGPRGLSRGSNGQTTAETGRSGVRVISVTVPRR